MNNNMNEQPAARLVSVEDVNRLLQCLNKSYGAVLMSIRNANAKGACSADVVNSVLRTIERTVISRWAAEIFPDCFSDVHPDVLATPKVGKAAHGSLNPDFDSRAIQQRVADAEGFLSPELALANLLASSKDVIDDYIDRFAEDVYDKDDVDEDDEEPVVVANGNPMALSDKDFVTYVEQKLLEADDLTLWTDEMEHGWLLIHGTDGVRDPEIAAGRKALRDSIEVLDAIRDRVQRTCNLV